MRLTVFAAVLLTGGLAAGAETVEAVLARMDKEAAGFHQITASCKRSEFTAVLGDTTSESGRLSMERVGREIVMRAEFTDPNARTVAVEDKKAEIYYPKLNRVEIYDLGKMGGLVDQFLVLGFGSSGKEIAKNYSVQAAGEEEVGGVRTTRLELTPKSAKTLEQIKQVTLWLPLDAGHPVQQKFLQPGGDYYLATYSDIRINPGLPDTAFRFNPPPGAQKVYPGK
jgi:outer membrane lipoprotein-sorting protein